MKNKSIKNVEDRILAIKNQLRDVGDMRPGSLTEQYRDPKTRTGPYYQISYTHKMQSKTEYVRREFINEVRQQIQNYKKFKELVEEWISLGIQHSQLSMKAEIERSGSQPRGRRK